jgi:beta-alanine--pyruvate transaminase
VITGFGRLGASFAAEKFDVNPDMITCAKGLTNGVIPAGAVICRNGLYSTLMESADREGKGSHIEFFHGYTYSGHPLAMAAGIATLEIYKEQDLFQRADDLAPYFEDALHSLKGLPHVIDIRNCGLMGAVELSPVLNFPTKRAGDIFSRCFEKGVFVRPTGSTIAMSPPLTFKKRDIDRLVGTLAESIVESSLLMTT